MSMEEFGKQKSAIFDYLFLPSSSDRSRRGNQSQRRRRRRLRMPVEEDDDDDDVGGLGAAVESVHNDLPPFAAFGISRFRSARRKRTKLADSKRKCHQCGKEDGSGILCSCCKERSYCESCVRMWYPRMSKERLARACPYCRRRCNCVDCLRLSAEPKENGRNIFLKYFPQNKHNLSVATMAS